MDSNYIYLEGLPEGISLVELSEAINASIKCDVIHMMQYHTSFGVIDFRSALAQLKAPMSLASTAVYKKTTFAIKGQEISFNFIPNIDTFYSYFLFFNARKNDVQNALSTFFDQSIIRSFIDIPGHFINVTAMQVSDRDYTLKKLRTFTRFEWKPIISDPTPFSLTPNDLFKLMELPKLQDVYIQYGKRKFGVCKAIASKFSKYISETKDQVIQLPKIEGPIDDVIDFLWGKSILLSFEKLPFLSIVADFLNSSQLKEMIKKYVEEKVPKESIASLEISFNYHKAPLVYK